MRGEFGELVEDNAGVRTAAEQTAFAALETAYPHLATRYDVAVQQARAMALGKLRTALSWERLDDIIPSAHTDHMHPVALLTAAMASRSDRADDDRWLRLSAELADSVANHALALVGESWRREKLTCAGAETPNALRWAARRAAADPGFSPLSLFEQAVVDGHPLHPCARIRGGMTAQELFVYAPEWADEVTLGIVAIARSAFTQSSFGDQGMTALLYRWHPESVDATKEYLRSVRRDVADYELLPVHPWQLRRTLPDRYADALADGRIIIIPPARILARPLLSLRTLALATNRRAIHLKTAVDIRLTTAVRIVSPATAHNGPMMSRLLAQISRRECGFGGRFVSLAELASASFRPAPDEPADAAASLAAIARESPERHVSEGEVALPAAAFAARSPLTGRPLLSDIFDELASTYTLPLRDAATRFLGRYCDCALPALFTLLSRWGIALEAHGQNTVVVVHSGLPVRLIYRDFGSIRVSRIRLTRRGLHPPALLGALLTEDEDELRARLFFPLVHTNLSQLVAALAQVADADPGSLWRLVAQRCRTVYATLTADPAIRAQAQRDETALFGSTIPMKAMLRTQMSANPHAPQWVAVPNPLVVIE
ncbi:MAG: IucA/IucC family protein [Pseudonocardiales bacterium]